MGKGNEKIRWHVWKCNGEKVTRCSNAKKEKGKEGSIGKENFVCKKGER